MVIATNFTTTTTTGHIPSYSLMNPTPEVNDNEEKEMMAIQIICQCAGISERELKYKSLNRKRELVEARQLHMVFRKVILGLSYRLVGLPYGKDHATAMHACRTVWNLHKTCPEFRNNYEDFFVFAVSVNNQFMNLLEMYVRGRN